VKKQKLLLQAAPTPDQLRSGRMITEAMAAEITVIVTDGTVGTEDEVQAVPGVLAAAACSERKYADSAHRTLRLIIRILTALEDLLLKEAKYCREE